MGLFALICVFTAALHCSSAQSRGDRSGDFIGDGSEPIKLGLEFENYTVNEGNSVSVCTRVTNGPLSSTVTLQFSTVSLLISDTPATAGVDYTSLPRPWTWDSGRLTFSSSRIRQCVSITTASDPIVESTEIFLVQLRNISRLPPFVELARTTATVSIRDNDEVEIGFSESSYTDSEGDNSEVCVAVRYGYLQRSVYVMVSTEDGTATAPFDYSPTSVELAINSTHRNFCVNISLPEDDLFNERISFWVVLQSNDFGVSLRHGRDRVAVNIIDNDAVLGLEFENYTVNEDSTVRVCVRVMNGTLRRTITLQLSTASPLNSETPATTNVDYYSLPGSFTSGRLYLRTYSTRQCFSIHTISDSQVEATEDFLVQLRAIDPLPPSVKLARTSATVFILDNDKVELGFDQLSYFANEGDDSVEVCASVSSRGSLQRTVQVTVNTEDGTATAPDDYIAASTRITIERLGRFCVNITLVDDKLHDKLGRIMYFTVFFESNDSAILVPRYWWFDYGVSVKIHQNDVLVIGLERESYTVSEAIRVVNASGSGNTTGEDTTVVQQTSVRVCAVVLNGTIENGTSAHVRFTTQNGTATGSGYDNSGDYTILNREVSIFENGTGCIEIEARDDDIVEGPEQFFVTLSVPLGTGIIIQPNSTATVTILDDDEALVIGLERESYTVSEAIRVVNVSGSGNTTGEDTTVVQQTSVRVCAVVLNGTIENGTSARVRFTTESGTARGVQRSSYYYRYKWYDYTTINTELNISENGTGCVDIEVIDNDITEGPEQFFVSLSVPFRTTKIIIQPNSTATVTILDDDVAVIGFTQTEYSVTEGRAVSVSLDILRGSLGDLGLIVHVYTMDGSATSSGTELQDYRPRNTTLTISSSRNPYIYIYSVEDEVDEDQETFFLRLELAVDMDIPIQFVKQAVVTILDDDGITVGLEDTAYSVLENAEMVEICAVLLQGALERETNITLSTVDGSATAPTDYSAISTILTFDESTSRPCGSVPITLDSIIEPEEFFSVSVATTDPDVTLKPETLVRVIITDSSEVVIGFETVAYEVSEGQNQEFCVAVLNGELELPVEVTLTTEDGTAVAPGDYLSGALRIVLAENINRVCVNIPTVDDTTVENTESFYAKLSTEDLRVSLLPATAIITIVDDDQEESIGAVEPCLPHMVTAVSIRAVLSGASGNQSTTQELQGHFTQFLTDEILEMTAFGPGCTFLSAELSSCVTRNGSTIAAFTADFTCNGRCIQSSSGVPENAQTSNTHRKLLMDTIAEEQPVSTTFEGGEVRITYFRSGQHAQSTITTVCSAGVAVVSKDNLCNCPVDCSSSKGT